MIQKLAILSGLLISSSCMVIPQVHRPLPIQLLYTLPQNEPNYNYAYEVNDFATGDIKSQSESRIGGIVLGQYTLVQPDGVIRNVEYRADDQQGFQATVNNIGTPVRLATNTIDNDEFLRLINSRVQTTEEPKAQENDVISESDSLPPTTPASMKNSPWS